MEFFINGGFQIAFFVVLFLVLCIFIAVAVTMIRQWNRNNHAPKLTVDATVVTKRTHITHRHNHGTEPIGLSNVSTTYYVTFQVESGDRIELPMSGYDYGMLAEGDRGKLTFQGTRYLGFQRM